MKTKKGMTFIPGPLIAWLLLCATSSMANVPSPTEVIEEAMKETETALDGRKDELAADPAALYAVIDKILLPRFDRRAAARFVLGKNARTTSDEQLNRFIDAFYGSLLRRYADGILEFDADKIKMLPFKGDLTKKSVKVNTSVTLDDGKEVPVNYRMVSRSSGWLILDVEIEGISYLQTFRSELESELRQKTLDEIIDRLNSESDEKPASE